MPNTLALALAVLGVAATSSVSASSSLYATDYKAGLVRIESTTGKLVPEGPERPEEAEGQELSTIDKHRGIYYIIGWNITTEKANLFGYDIHTHNVTVDRELPLSESAFVGVGQAIDADPVSGDLIIVGRTTHVMPNSTTHAVLRFYANESFATYSHIANLHGIDILDGSSAFDPVHGVEYVGMIASGTPPKIEFNLFAVDVKTGHVKTIKQDATHGKSIVNLDFDKHTGRIYGIGADVNNTPPTRALMYLDPKDDEFTLVADVPAEFYMQDGNLVALDEEQRVFYALLTVGGQPNVTHWAHSDKCKDCTGSPAQCCYDPAEGPSTYTCFAVTNCSQITNGGGAPDLHEPFHLFGMHIDTGTLVSKSPPVCALIPNGTTPNCPWTIESAQ